MSIPLKFGLFWSGAKLSYLRYLTFKSLRHFHPDAEISLYCSNFNDSIINWNDEAQDFQNKHEVSEDYFDKLHDLGIKIKIKDEWSSYLPNFQSDFFRWWWLKEYGGFYLDCDQIILRNFSTLPLDSKMICSVYEAKSCGIYAPVGVIGADPDSELLNVAKSSILNAYQKSNYNSAGPFMFINIIRQYKGNDVISNMPSGCFYPVSESYKVQSIFSGDLQLGQESYALHWFGGHPISQKFNAIYTREFAKKSNDTISRFLRENNII